MNKIDFFSKYFDELSRLIHSVDHEVLINIATEMLSCCDKGGKILAIGNGGSAAIVSHFTVDLTKTCGIRAVNFNESSLLTCFSNDYGYENWVVEALKAYSDPKDIVVLISSSGESKNIVNAAKWSSENGLTSVCLSGFEDTNTLRQFGNFHLWANSNKYNHIENCHQVWLLALLDYMNR
jgi:D-sedoheptulose 7-phosphate isomerase